MDQELVQYLDERFHGLVHGLDQRFERIDQRFEQIDQRFGQIDQRFEQIDQRFERVDQRFEQIDQRFGQIDRRFEGIDRRFEGIDHRFNEENDRFDEVNERIEEVKRHSGVLIEDLRYQVRLVAEGFATFVEGRYAQDQARIDERFNETQALLRTSFEHLTRQDDQLRQRPFPSAPPAS